MKCYEMFVFFLLPFFSVVFCSPVKREVPDIFKSNDDTLLFAHVVSNAGRNNVNWVLALIIGFNVDLPSW